MFVGIVLSICLPMLSPKEVDETAKRIYHNECSSKVENLIHWNEGEEFLSLGIGHFIWYSEGFKGPFDEQFPRFIAYCRQKQIALPQFFEQNRFCPWKNRVDFLKAPQKTIDELRSFLLQTKAEQAQFMVDALFQTFAELPSVKERFVKVAKTPQGMYALIDYVNFKGKGLKASEKYKNRGWGLLQLLEEMNDQQEVMASFRAAAKKVLAERVANAPPERKEERWLQGWNNRIDTYK
jgi:hypothetical protein